MRKMLTKAQTFIHEELEVAQFLRRARIFNISKAFQHVAFFRRNFKEPALHGSKPTPAQNEVFSGFLVFFEVAFSLFICCFDAQILWKGKNAWCERGISFGITFRVDYIANHVIRRLIFKVAELNGLVWRIKFIVYLIHCFERPISPPLSADSLAVQTRIKVN